MYNLLVVLIARNFYGCKFSAKMFVGSNIRISVLGNHTHQYLKYQYVGVHPGFNFCVNCSALKNAKCLRPTKIPPYNYGISPQTRNYITDK